MYCNTEFSKISKTYDVSVPVFTIKMNQKEREVNYKRRKIDYIPGLTDSPDIVAAPAPV